MKEEKVNNTIYGSENDFNNNLNKYIRHSHLSNFSNFFGGLPQPLKQEGRQLKETKREIKSIKSSYSL